MVSCRCFDGMKSWLSFVVLQFFEYVSEQFAVRNRFYIWIYALVLLVRCVVVEPEPSQLLALKLYPSHSYLYFLLTISAAKRSFISCGIELP